MKLKIIVHNFHSILIKSTDDTDRETMVGVLWSQDGAGWEFYSCNGIVIVTDLQFISLSNCNITNNMMTNLLGPSVGSSDYL